MGDRCASRCRTTIYKRDEYGSQILARLARAPRFNAWMADTIRPFCGQRVLEIGSGVGNLTQKLIPRREYVVSDINPLYLQTLASLRQDRPYLSASYCDVTDLASFPRAEGGYDTVICLNVIEHVDGRPRRAREHPRVAGARTAARSCWCRRASGTSARSTRCSGTGALLEGRRCARLAATAGFEVERILEFNRDGHARPGS